MKMSKAERKAYNAGKQAGYAEGYLKGFHDGNPFNAVAEAIANAMRKIGDMASSPEFLEALKAANEAGDFGEWIGSGDNDNYCYCSECNYGDTFFELPDKCPNCGMKMNTEAVVHE